MLGPPELLARIHSLFTIRLPTSFAIFANHSVTRDGTRIAFTINLFPLNQDKVSLAPLRELAFDRGFPNAILRTVRPCTMKQNTRVTNIFIRGISSPPTIFNFKMIIFVSVPSGKITHIFIATPQDSIIKSKNVIRICTLRFLQPGGKPFKVFLIEWANHLSRSFSISSKTIKW